MLDVDNRLQSDVVSNVCFVRFVETAVVLALTQKRNFVLGQRALMTNVVVQIHNLLLFLDVAANGSQVVATEDHVLRGGNYRFAVGKFQNVVCRKHKEACFRLRLDGKRYVHCHLVAVEVGVECRTCKGVQFDCASFDKYGFKCLDGQTVQRGCAVEQHGVLSDYAFQNIPHLCVGALYTLLCRLDVVALSRFHQFVHYKRLEQFQCHFLGNTALVKFEFRSYHDYGTTGVVHTFTKQVLTETTLLTAKQTTQ